jgi:rubrerythrin
MKTSRQWWAKTKADPVLLIDWLKDQYHGEMKAAERIKELFFATGNTLSVKQTHVIQRIVKEEKAHAKWIKRLLVARGVTPEILKKEERYWDKVLTEDSTSSTENLAAVAYHAESMRLERVSVIANDWSAPKDIRVVFKRILPMELNHTKWFKKLTTDEHIANLLPNHQQGLNALGLVI